MNDFGKKILTLEDFSFEGKDALLVVSPWSLQKKTGPAKT
jgi:hypothetical protein